MNRLGSGWGGDPSLWARRRGWNLGAASEDIFEETVLRFGESLMGREVVVGAECVVGCGEGVEVSTAIGGRGVRFGTCNSFKNRVGGEVILVFVEDDFCTSP